MNSFIQIITLILSFFYGIITFVVSKYSYIFLRESPLLFKLLYYLILYSDLCFTFIYIIYKINNGVFSIYYLIFYVIGILMLFIINKCKITI